MSYEPRVLETDRPDGDYNPNTCGVDYGYSDRHLPDPATILESADRLRDMVREDVTGPALAVAASLDGEVVASGYVPTRVDGLNAAIVGRHTRCDFYLGADPSVSLRHLAILVPPAVEVADLRYRVLDLRAERPIHMAGDDDARVPLTSFESESDSVIRCGRYDVAFMPVDGGRSRELDIQDLLPANVFMSAHRGQARRSRSARPEPGESSRLLPSPCPTGSITVDGLSDERHESALPRPRLEILGRRGLSCLGLTDEELERGVLVGRYNRCDIGGGAVMRGNVSRVHALIVRHGGDIWLVDTASRNGTRIAGRRVRAHRLPEDHRVTIELADMELTWMP